MKEKINRQYFDAILKFNEDLDKVIRMPQSPIVNIKDLSLEIINAKELGKAFDESWVGPKEESPDVVPFLEELEKLVLLSAERETYKDRIKFLSKVKMYLNNFISAHGGRFNLI